MFIEEELDSGPILLQSETAIHHEETAAQLMERLAAVGAELLSETLANIRSITPTRQNDDNASFAPLLKKEDGKVDWFMDAFAIERRVRGFQPWPNVYAFYRSHRLIIWSAAPKKLGPDEQPAGTILVAHGEELAIKCGNDTALQLLEVQPEGGRRMTAREFINGARLEAGRQIE
jgi:methionyl-tRNA formyltransferase